MSPWNSSLRSPRFLYIQHFKEFFKNEDDRLFTTNVRYKETNSKDVVRLVSSKEFDLGIVRCQVLYEPFFLKMIQDEHLDSKVLWQFSPKVLMSPSHPSCRKGAFRPPWFSQSVELLQGDIQYPSFNPGKYWLVSFRTVIPAIPFIFMTGAASMISPPSSRCLYVDFSCSVQHPYRRKADPERGTRPIMYSRIF